MGCRCKKVVVGGCFDKKLRKVCFCKTCKKQFALVLWENIAVYPPKTLSTRPGIKLSPKTLIKTLFITFVECYKIRRQVKHSIKGA